MGAPDIDAGDERTDVIANQRGRALRCPGTQSRKEARVLRGDPIGSEIC